MGATNHNRFVPTDRSFKIPPHQTETQSRCSELAEANLASRTWSWRISFAQSRCCPQHQHQHQHQGAFSAQPPNAQPPTTSSSRAAWCRLCRGSCSSSRMRKPKLGGSERKRAKNQHFEGSLNSGRAPGLEAWNYTTPELIISKEARRRLFGRKVDAAVLLMS